MMEPVNQFASAPAIAPPIPEKPTAVPTSCGAKRSVGSVIRFDIQIEWPMTTAHIAARASHQEGTNGAIIAAGNKAAPMVIVVLRARETAQPARSNLPASQPPNK